MYKTKVEEVLALNKIDSDMFCKKIYNTLISSIFVFVCKEIKKKGNKIEEKERFRKFENKLVATKCLVSRYVEINIRDEEYQILAQYFMAYFSKDISRKQFDNSLKLDLLAKQKCKCQICRKDINISNAHLDHIIAWDYVGDNLTDNYQMLCGTCNDRKSNYIDYELTNILIKKNN